MADRIFGWNVPQINANIKTQEVFLQSLNREPNFRLRFSTNFFIPKSDTGIPRYHSFISEQSRLRHHQNDWQNREIPSGYPCFYVTNFKDKIVTNAHNMARLWVLNWTATKLLKGKLIADPRSALQWLSRPIKGA